MDCILALIFERFWWILGGKLGSKIEQKSIQKGIGKVMKKRTSPKLQKWRSKTPRGDPAPGFQSPGERVGRGINPSPREGGKGIETGCHLKPPSHQGLVGFQICVCNF